MLDRALSGVSLSAALVAVLAISACGTTALPGDTIVESPRLAGLNARSLGGGEWNMYLKVMSGREIKQFQGIENKDDRLLFIKRNGIDVRRELNDRLRTGMSKASVKDALDDMTESAFEEDGPRLFCWRYNGLARTNIYCVFSDVKDKDAKTGEDLVTWGSYTDHQAEEEREINGLEGVLALKLSRVLREGMGPNEITQSYQKAVDLKDQFEKKMTESSLRGSYAEEDRKMVEEGKDGTTRHAGYAAWHTPNAGDYAYEAEWLRVQKQPEFYRVLNRKPDYVRTEGNAECWYHVLPFRDSSDLYIVIEYRFKSSLLESWYVYHTDFLGLGRFK